MQQQNVSSRAGEMRLTRRGRLVVAGFLALLAAGAGLGLVHAQAEVMAEPVPVTLHTVAAGETLWGIATSATTPGADVRDVLLEISELNQLDGSRIIPGQRLMLPRD